ncbi:hypothetical protein [Chitinophaga vietnamensis]|uniref:hypothetical protein n=1 Tax=Chitinophaga vietnamensis TaxID=2593957 RepID=UPI0011782BC1|nr:hypothetical protein [Chitinophaga vietnamensis]
MKTKYQLEPLSDKELLSTNGGGLLDGFFGSAVTGGDSSTVDYTGYTTGMGFTYFAFGNGHATYMAASGAGMYNFLSNLRFPTS